MTAIRLTPSHEGLRYAVADPSRAPLTAESALRRIFARQQQHRWTVARSSAAERRRKLRALAASIERHRAEVADAIQADFGKHPLETELTEIQLTLTELRDAVRNVHRWMRRRRVRTPLHLFGTRSEIRYEPKGVVLILAAWNYPFALILAPLIAAVAAGNCAIVRPSEKVPATNAVLARILAEVFDEREVAMVQGDARIAESLLALPFDHIFFTGSTRVGRMVAAAAAQTLASTTLELGGKSPAIVDETADVALAAERVVWGKFVSAGQACVAPDYVLVHQSRAAEFVAAAKRSLAALYGPTESDRAASPDFARVIDSASVARLATLVDDAVARGAVIEAGGLADVAGRYMAPTILSGVDPYSAIMGDEIFGPVLPVLTYRAASEAIDIVRAHGKPLAMYVFSRSRASVEDLIAGTPAGGTLINNTLLHLTNPNLPFGGAGESGSGSYHGEFGFRAFSHERSVVTQGRFSLMRLFYPPYGARTSRMVRLVGWLRS